MKKREILLLSTLAIIVIILSLIQISAIDITLSKSSYFSGETLQAEISGSFIDNLLPENIGIYQEGSVHKTPAEAGLIKSEGKYLYYAILPELPEQAGIYYVRIENTRYYSSNKPTSSTINKSFTVSSSNSPYLSFRPGNIQATTDFNIIIKAYNGQQQVTIDFPEANFKRSFTIASMQEESVLITTSQIKNSTKSNIKVNSYNIPVIFSAKSIPNNLTANKTNHTIETDLALEDALSVKSSNIEASLLANIDYNFKLILTKETEDAVSNLKIYCSDENIKISPDSIEEMSDEEIINLTINSNQDISGFIKIYREDKENDSIKIPLEIIIVTNKSKVNVSQPGNQVKTCSNLNGNKCDYDAGESCSGSQTFASDGLCCLGTCKKPASSKAWIIGLLLLAIVAVGIWFLYKKSKQDPATAEKLKSLFKKKTEDYKNRIQPKPDFEVKKSLTRT